MVLKTLKNNKHALTGAAVALSLMAGITGAAQSEEFNPDQKEQIEQMIRNYLLEHPEIVIEAAQKYRAQQEEAERDRVAGAISGAVLALKEDESYPRVGNADGDVQFVEFFDYQCGYCKQVFPMVMDLLEEDKQLDVVMVEFPVLGPVSEYASRAALASKKQGKYMEYHVALMENRGRLSESKILKIAESVELDVDQLKKDMDTAEVSLHIQKNRHLAQALGLRGTPAFLIGEGIAPGAISKDQMVEMIENARQGS